ncbi:formyltransferase family protein [Campylobacter sp. 9BO]|uniref:formyltransferase family protein n=1 Tax=Campylobacter sp. 9BO TaxID=3424759 RepID=UPI003D35378D
MKILYLGPYSELVEFLKDDKNIIYQNNNKIDENFIIKEKFDFLISYRYRYILPAQILRHFIKSAINLHTSFLPFNRGSDPNFWSFVDGTPNGVSIHYMNEGLDKGDIIAQEIIVFDARMHTFASSYNILQREIQKLFKRNWFAIKNKTIVSRPQQTRGGG